MQEFIQLILDAIQTTALQAYIPPFVVFVILALFGWLINFLFATNFKERLAWFTSQFSSRNVDPQVQKLLEKNFPYYSSLDEKAKNKFLKRLAIFMGMKTFVPRAMELNESINLLIGATAVQLTFGLNNVAFFSFEKILIYPSSYYSTIRDTYHKGEVNARLRIIVLSAKHFLEGVQDEKDGLNLGLHEMSHAMQIHAIYSLDKRFINRFNKWQAIAEKEIMLIKQGNNHFLREYAATNAAEMFAVCVENFFERPQEFKLALPDLYGHMKGLLNQDPLQVNNPVL